jgi:hypothetical protein
MAEHPAEMLRKSGRQQVLMVMPIVVMAVEDRGRLSSFSW